MALKNRDFVRYGVKFHIYDYAKRNEYDCRYILAYWNETRKCWLNVAWIDSKREALQAIEELYNSRVRCFAEQ